MSTTNETKRDAEYDAKVKEAFALLFKLQGHIENHSIEAKAKPGDWGYVGDMGRVVELLREAVAPFEGE